MINHPYVMEKLMELEAERVARVQHYRLPAQPSRASSVLRAVGRALRAAGEGLESWGATKGAPSVRRDISCPDAKHY